MGCWLLVTVHLTEVVCGVNCIRDGVWCIACRLIVTLYLIEVVFGVNINNIVFVMGCWLVVTMYLIEVVCGLSVRVGCRGRVRGVG